MAYSLNLALIEACESESSNEFDRAFLATCRNLTNFIQATPKRYSYLEKKIKLSNSTKSKLITPADNRWSTHTESVVTILCLYDEIIESLRDILLNEEDELDRCTAFGLRAKMKFHLSFICSQRSLNKNKCVKQRFAEKYSVITVSSRFC